MLNSQKPIVAHGEVFRRLHGKSPGPLLSDLFCRYPRFVKAVGVKVFYYHPLDDDSGELWEEFQNIEDLLVIHLKRRNILRTLLSRKIAAKVDVWIDRGKNGSISLEDRRVSFSEEELLKGFEETRRWEENCDALFAGSRLLEVFYEDLVARPAEVLGGIGGALGVRINGAQTTMRRQNPDRLSSLIENYQKMKSSFADTQWSPFFED
jgi:LPS sulfotransferase NodH